MIYLKNSKNAFIFFYIVISKPYIAYTYILWRPRHRANNLAIHTEPPGYRSIQEAVDVRTPASSEGIRCRRPGPACHPSPQIHNPAAKYMPHLSVLHSRSTPFATRFRHNIPTNFDEKSSFFLLLSKKLVILCSEKFGM